MQLTVDDTKELIDMKINNAEKEYGKAVKLLILEILSLQNNMREEQTRYIEVSKWNNYHPYPTVSGLRNLINRSKENGFDEHNVIHRQNGRLFVNEKNYFKWFEHKT